LIDLSLEFHFTRVVVVSHFARAAPGAESRRCHCDDDGDGGGRGRGGVDDSSDQSPYKLFVFGDSFADAGNALKGRLGLNTRGWYEPCGVSDARHGGKPTGRCSDGMVQSDFVGAYASSQSDQCSSDPSLFISAPKSHLV